MYSHIVAIAALVSLMQLSKDKSEFFKISAIAIIIITDDERTSSKECKPIRDR